MCWLRRMIQYTFNLLAFSLIRQAIMHIRLTSYPDLPSQLFFFFLHEKNSMAAKKVTLSPPPPPPPQFYTAAK